MKNIVKLGLILMAYAGIAGLFLGWIYTKTKPKIDEQARIEREMAIKEVMPVDATAFDEKTLSDGTDVTVGYADEALTQPVGYAAIAVGGGFSSNIKTMVGITLDGNVNAIKVIFQSETPGLGTHVQDEWFQNQFADRTVNDLLVDKDGGTVKAITGATISTRTVAVSIKELLKKIQSMEGELQQNTEPAPADSMI